eukprot:6176831-Pleurochrysis_carterae.AAC.1
MHACIREPSDLICEFESPACNPGMFKRVVKGERSTLTTRIGLAHIGLAEDFVPSRNANAESFSIQASLSSVITECRIHLARYGFCRAGSPAAGRRIEARAAASRGCPGTGAFLPLSFCVPSPSLVLSLFLFVFRFGSLSTLLTLVLKP